MNQREFDVVVIGAGMAGLTAARKIAEGGLKVSVVARGVGATNMSSGAIDLLGYVPAEDASKLSLNPEEAIKELVSKHPEHPYGILGGGNDVGSEERGKRATKVVREAVEDFKKRSEKLRPEYVGETTENLFLTNFLGTFKPTCLVPSTMYPGDLRKFENARVLFVGIRGFADFNPAYASKSVLYLAKTLLKKWGVKIKSVEHAYIELPGFEGRRNILSAEIGRALDCDEVLMGVINRLKKIVKKGEHTHLALPIIGMDRPEENLKALEEATGVRVFEILPIPPSVPGSRLQAFLETAARNSGASLNRGYEAVNADVRDGICEKITVQSIVGLKKAEYSAKVFILATGDLIGGGLVSENRVIREPLFNLPITPQKGANPEDFTTWVLDEPFPSEDHPVSSLGVEVDSSLRPMKGEKTMLKNVYVAGAILSRLNYNAEKSGLGVCLASGYLAGMNAVGYVKS